MRNLKRRHRLPAPVQIALIVLGIYTPVVLFLLATGR
jgi:hypothetical protein